MSSGFSEMSGSNYITFWQTIGRSLALSLSPNLFRFPVSRSVSKRDLNAIVIENGSLVSDFFA